MCGYRAPTASLREAREAALQLTGRMSVPVDAVTRETALCDCVHAGAVDEPGVPRARQEIPPAVRRKVLLRDKEQCRVPGCSNARYVDVHHKHFRMHGGDNDPSNLLCLCWTHHRAVHSGRLIIEGDTEADARFLHADGRPYGTKRATSRVDEKSDAFLALRSAGFSRAEARARLEAAVAHVGEGAAPQLQVKAALAAPATEETAEAIAVSALRNLGAKQAEAEHWVKEAVAHVGASASAEALTMEAVRRRYSRDATIEPHVGPAATPRVEVKVGSAPAAEETAEVIAVSTPAHVSEAEHRVDEEAALGRDRGAPPLPHVNQGAAPELEGTAALSPSAVVSSAEVIAVFALEAERGVGDRAAHVGASVPAEAPPSEVVRRRYDRSVPTEPRVDPVRHGQRPREGFTTPPPHIVREHSKRADAYESAAPWAEGASILGEATRLLWAA